MQHITYCNCTFFGRLTAMWPGQARQLATRLASSRSGKELHHKCFPEQMKRKKKFVSINLFKKGNILVPPLSVSWGRRRKPSWGTNSTLRTFMRWTFIKWRDMFNTKDFHEVGIYQANIYVQNEGLSWGGHISSKETYST